MTIWSHRFEEAALLVVFFVVVATGGATGIVVVGVEVPVVATEGGAEAALLEAAFFAIVAKFCAEKDPRCPIGDRREMGFAKECDRLEFVL